MTTTLNKQERFAKRTLLSGLLTDISVGWKMVLIVFILMLGITGITVSAYLGLQSLRHQLSNIYDFMLVPIVAINNADAALASAQYEILQSRNQDITEAERTQNLTAIAPNNQLALNTIARYDTEWVTTASPEFTQALRQGGKLDLQKQELAALADLHNTFDSYQTSFENYLTSVKRGSPDAKLANESLNNLQIARANLDKLIEINNQYAEFSNTLAVYAYQQAIQTGTLVLVISIALGFLISYLIAGSITSRLNELTISATAMQAGDLNQTVTVAGRDEVALLGLTFNTMAKQLSDLFSSLEQRITARTKDLATVAEVSTATATILETQALLQAVVDLSKERFGLYHAHIYLLDEEGENLILTAGAGEPGRIMAAEKRSISIHREQSLVARAAREQKGVIVNDVTQAPDFLPNPLLPETRAELAAPMIVGGKVIGVFDVQSEQVGRFTEADISVKTTLAAQVATSIQNVRSFEQSRKQAELESMANTIGQKIQRATSVEETLQTAIRELGTVLGASRVKATISAQKNGSN